MGSFPEVMFFKHYIPIVTNNKNELLKTVRLISFQNPSLPFFVFAVLFISSFLCSGQLLSSFAYFDGSSL